MQGQWLQATLKHDFGSKDRAPASPLVSTFTQSSDSNVLISARQVATHFIGSQTPSRP